MQLTLPSITPNCAIALSSKIHPHSPPLVFLTSPLSLLPSSVNYASLVTRCVNGANSTNIWFYNNYLLSDSAACQLPPHHHPPHPSIAAPSSPPCALRCQSRLHPVSPSLRPQSPSRFQTIFLYRFRRFFSPCFFLNRFTKCRFLFLHLLAAGASESVRPHNK